VATILKADFGGEQAPALNQNELPAWLCCEWADGDSISKLIEDYGLRKYSDSRLQEVEMGCIIPALEADVLNKLHREARALRKYMAGKYQDVLTQDERRILRLEMRCLKDKPFFTPRARHEWIAEQMTSAFAFWTWRGVAATLAEVSSVLADYYDLELQEKLEATLRSLKSTWFEVKSELQTAIVPIVRAA
jgi:hypothetical protein